MVSLKGVMKLVEAERLTCGVIITDVSVYFLRSSGLTIKLVVVVGGFRSFWKEGGVVGALISGTGVESPPNRALKKWPKSGLTAPALAF